MKRFSIWTTSRRLLGLCFCNSICVCGAKYWKFWYHISFNPDIYSFWQECKDSEDAFPHVSEFLPATGLNVFSCGGGHREDIVMLRVKAPSQVSQRFSEKTLLGSLYLQDYLSLATLWLICSGHAHCLPWSVCACPMLSLLPASVKHPTILLQLIYLMLLMSCYLLLLSTVQPLVQLYSQQYNIATIQSLP